MSDINVRSESVDVEQIMRQIRTRIREKRGADYTEAELQQLATVKLEKFIDPRGLRSDLIDQFRKKHAVSPAPPNYEFGEDTLYETHRGLLKTLRNLFRPLLKLFFNPDRITTALHLQSTINTQGEDRLRRLEERGLLSYELLHNMTLEITRLGIEVHNLKMRVESLSSRVDFDERRARSLEGVVQYRTPPPPRQAAPSPAARAAVAAPPTAETAGAPTEAPAPRTEAADDDSAAAGNGERRRRRRRRRRRPGSTMADAQGQTAAQQPGDSGDAEADENGGDDNDTGDADPTGSTGQ